MNFRYITTDRRIIGATVGYGAVAPFLKGSWSTFWACLWPPYVKASTTSMVMGHLLARLATRIEQNIPGNLKTFCIGYSLGGQLCGFAGKDYRYGLHIFKGYQYY